MAGEDSKRPWLDFLKDMFIDGYKLIGASAPVLSIGFTIAKALDLHIGLENISYAWGLLPLLLWVLIAYWRRWLVSRELSVEQRGQADRVAGWMEAADLDLKAPLILQNSSDQLVYDLVASVVTAGGGDLNHRCFVGQLPPGKSKHVIEHPGHGMHKRFSIELAFRDSNGRNWVRDGSGVLQQIETDPLAHYGIDPPVSWLVP
jgi:hypothetical protein